VPSCPLLAHPLLPSCRATPRRAVLCCAQVASLEDAPSASPSASPRQQVGGEVGALRQQLQHMQAEREELLMMLEAQMERMGLFPGGEGAGGEGCPPHVGGDGGDLFDGALPPPGQGGLLPCEGDVFDDVAPPEP
jgi:hypothetical protein